MSAAHMNGAAMPPDEYFGDVVELPIPPDGEARAPWAERIAPCESSWFTKTPPKRSWLLRDARTDAGVLPLGKVGMLIAEGGAGKTMALIALILATATGSRWFGTFTIANPGKVLALLGEEDHEEVWRRSYNDRRATNGPIPDDGAIIAIPLAGVPCATIETDREGNPTETTFLLWLRAYVKEHGPFALVIVDPLSRFAGTDTEANPAAATRFVQALESIATECGATVIVAHHTNKLSHAAGVAVTGAAARGTTAIFDGVRWAAALTAEKVEIDDPTLAGRLGEVVTFSIVKSNYSRKAEPLSLRRDNENGGALLPLDSHDEVMLDEARTDASPSVRRSAIRDEERRTRNEAVDAALMAVLAEHPGIGTRDLRAALARHLGSCSADTAADALARCVSRVRREVGPGRNVRHYLATEEG